MLAARDQENLVHNQQTLAASKPANQGMRHAAPKTPGNKFPKTPLRVPLHDENAPVGLGGKSVLATKGKGAERNTFVTPMGPQNRAPLGMKTTNAKTKVYQTPVGPGLDKDFGTVISQKPTSARRMKQRVSHADTIKIDVHTDVDIPLDERDVEYAPPKPKERPYESDVFPADSLNFDVLKGANLTRGWQDIYINPVDENGVTRKEREFEENKAKALKAADEKVLKAMEELDWSVSDVPSTVIAPKMVKEAPAIKKETTTRSGPATFTARRAASVLSVTAKSNAKVVTRKPTLTTSSRLPSSLLGRAKAAPVAASSASDTNATRHTTATAASRSTLGYSKGRSASGVLRPASACTTKPAPRTQRGLPRSASGSSTTSDKTITPARYAQAQAPDFATRDISRPAFLSIFDHDDEADLDIQSGLPDCLKADENEDEEFIMTLE